MTCGVFYVSSFFEHTGFAVWSTTQVYYCCYDEFVKTPEVSTSIFFENRAIQLHHLCPVYDIFGYVFTDCLLYSSMTRSSRVERSIFLPKEDF